jgi:hypothetical protein
MKISTILIQLTSKYYCLKSKATIMKKISLKAVQSIKGGGNLVN